MTFCNKKVIVAILFLWFAAPNVFAATPITTTASATAPSAPTIKELSAQLEELLVVTKDDISIPAEEKATKELELRIQILQKVILLSYEELDKLYGKIETLPLLNDAEKERAASSLATLSEYRSRYETVWETLSKNSTLEQTIKLASELRDWRATLYIPAMKEISNFVLVLQKRSVIKTGFERRTKIESDLKKLSQGNYITTKQAVALSQMLTEAEAFLNSAQLANGDAYKLVFTAQNPAEPIAADADVLIKTSLEKIKSAYTIFLDMSRKVKEILGL